MIRRPPRSTLFPLHDALPILPMSLITTGPIAGTLLARGVRHAWLDRATELLLERATGREDVGAYEVRGLLDRSEEHTSELQSRQYLVCRLLLEKKNQHLLPGR